ncbi:hypothetical protein [Sphingobacterium sp. LRF_L2]|uniref:hypothetical protein n=1 Tax=Sphingobacterium sp. LRF_L2 TaxID=3369421 RepID=UPI003F6473D9
MKHTAIQRYKLLFINLCGFFCSCHSSPLYYYGQVLDENNTPIESVYISKLYDDIGVVTDKRGYFKMDRSADRLDDLIFSKEGYITDTIPSVWRQNGEAIRYNFINHDTTFVKLIKKKKQPNEM